MMYALKQIVFDRDPQTKRFKSHYIYITVASGLSWQAAKSQRNQNRRQGLSIVPERATS